MVELNDISLFLEKIYFYKIDIKFLIIIFRRDATLKELSNLVKEVNEDSKRKDARMTFKHVKKFYLPFFKNFSIFKKS